MNRLRLVNFQKVKSANSKAQVGLLLNQGPNPFVVNLRAKEFSGEFDGKFDMVDLYNDHDNKIMSAIRKVASRINDEGSFASKPYILPLDPSKVKLLPPVTPVRNIICIGKNYSDHIAEVKKRDEKDGTATPASAPQYPMFFTKATTTVIGPHTPVPSHNTLTKWLDYEAELAVVIGKGGVNISVENAMQHVFGYTCANDVSARDLQRRHGQFFKGKTLDGTCPLGPCVVPASDVDPNDLSIRLWLNGELKQNSRTSKMIFNIPAIIASLSEGFTLLPGDVILTGTPDGVAYAANPPFSLKSGDDMTVEIEHIGRLDNKVI